MKCARRRSTRIPKSPGDCPLVVGKEPNKSVTCTRSFAIGAAVQAGVLSEKDRHLLLDVLRSVWELKPLAGFTKLIDGTTIPTRKSEIFSRLPTSDLR